jgi:glutaredoxin
MTEVIVFGMDDCAGCVTVKAVLKAKGVFFVEYDVMNTEHMAKAQEYGVRGVPTVVVKLEGVDHFFTGSTKPVIDSLLLHIGV